MTLEEFYNVLEGALANAEELAEDESLDESIRQLAETEAGEWRVMLHAMRAMPGFFVPGAGVQL